MCLAIPVRGDANCLPDDMAQVSLDGVVKTISIALVEDVQVGDYVVLHVGYALTKIDPDEAQKTLALLRRGSGGVKEPTHEIRRRISRRQARPTHRRRRSRARRGPIGTYRFMEFCGGHTHAISRYGLEDLLPPNVRMIHGPGCPVCVLPMARIDVAIACARDRRRHALHLWRPDARARLERHRAC